MKIISMFEPTDGTTVWMDSNGVNVGESLMDGCRVLQNSVQTPPPLLPIRGL